MTLDAATALADRLDHEERTIRELYDATHPWDAALSADQMATVLRAQLLGSAMSIPERQAVAQMVNDVNAKRRIIDAYRQGDAELRAGLEFAIRALSEQVYTVG